MGLTVLETNMLQLPQAIYGTWQSDADRTLTEIKRHLRADHPRLKEFESPARFIPLTISFAPDAVLYTYRDEQVLAQWRILGCDEFFLVSEVEPTWINEQVLWHTHFLSENCYWVTVDLDWGFIYREFFIRVSAETLVEAGVSSEAMELNRTSDKPICPPISDADTVSHPGPHRSPGWRTRPNPASSKCQ